MAVPGPVLSAGKQIPGARKLLSLRELSGGDTQHSAGSGGEAATCRPTRSQQVDEHPGDRGFQEEGTAIGAHRPKPAGGCADQQENEVPVGITDGLMDGGGRRQLTTNY